MQHTALSGILKLIKYMDIHINKKTAGIVILALIIGGAVGFAAGLPGGMHHRAMMRGMGEWKNHYGNEERDLETDDDAATTTSTGTGGKVVGIGERCGGNMTTAPSCSVGLHCAPTPGSHLPMGDVGGTCVKD